MMVSACNSSEVLIAAHPHALLHAPMQAHSQTAHRTQQHGLMSKVVASLLVSVLALGFKLNELPLIVQMNQRRNELKANLILLQRQLELEDLVIWLDQTALDTAHRQEWIAAMESA